MNQLLAPFLVAGLLLQDLHVAGGVLGEALRAADPPRRRPRPRGRSRRSRPLREGLRALRRAGDRRRPGRPDGGARRRPRRRARDPVRTRISGSAAGCSPSATTIDGKPGAGWAGAGRGRTRARCPTCGSCAAPTVFGVYDHGAYGAVERVNDHLPVPPAHRAAPAAAGRSWRSAPCWRPARSSARSCSATTTGPA